MKNNKLSLFIVIILLACSILYFAVWQDSLVTAEDSRGYFRPASDLVDGSLEEFHFRTLGYPVLLLLTGSVSEPTLSLFVVQLLMYMLSVYMVSKILIQLHVQQTFILFFVILAMLPPSVEYTSYALPEVATMFFLTISFYAIFKSLSKNNFWWGLGSGFALGIGAIIRPDYQFLGIFISIIAMLFLLMLKLWPIWKKVFLPLLISSSFCLIAYMGFNLIRFQKFTMAYFSGFTMTAKTVNMLEDIPDNYAEIREILIDARNKELVNGKSHSAVNYIYEASGDLQKLTGLDMPQLASLINKININLIYRNPLQYLVSVGTAMANFILPSATNQSIFSSSMVQLLWTVIHFVILGIFILTVCTMVGCFVMAFTTDKNRSQSIVEKINKKLPNFLIFIIALSSVIYIALISTFVAVGDARYHVPTQLMTFFTVVVFSWLVYKTKKNNSVLINS